MSETNSQVVLMKDLLELIKNWIVGVGLIFTGNVIWLSDLSSFERAGGVMVLFMAAISFYAFSISVFISHRKVAKMAPKARTPWQNVQVALILVVPVVAAALVLNTATALVADELKVSQEIGRTAGAYAAD